MVVVARRQARRDPHSRRRCDRVPGRRHRPGHDPRDGQAAAGVATRGGPCRPDLPVLCWGRLAAGRGDVRAVRDRLDGVHAAATARGGRADHAVELPGGDSGVEGRAGARVREHGRVEARAGLAVDRAPSRSRARGGRASRGRVERRDRPRERGRGAAGGRSARARDLVHRLGAGRPRCPRSRRVARKACPARARRPQSSDRGRGREARRRGDSGVRGCVLVGGSEVHGHTPDLRPGLGLRLVPRALPGAHRRR